MYILPAFAENFDHHCPWVSTDRVYHPFFLSSPFSLYLPLPSFSISPSHLSLSPSPFSLYLPLPLPSPCMSFVVHSLVLISKTTLTLIRNF